MVLGTTSTTRPPRTTATAPATGGTAATGQWLPVWGPSGNAGYVWKDYATPGATDPMGRWGQGYTVNAQAGLNVRSAPNLSARIIETVPYGHFIGMNPQPRPSGTIPANPNGPGTPATPAIPGRPTTPTPTTPTPPARPPLPAYVPSPPQLGAEASAWSGPAQAGVAGGEALAPTVVRPSAGPTYDQWLAGRSR